MQHREAGEQILPDGLLLCAGFSVPRCLCGSRLGVVSRMAVTMSPSFAHGLHGMADFAFDHIRRHALAVFAGFVEELTHQGKLGRLVRVRQLRWWNDLADDVAVAVSTLTRFIALPP